MSNAAFGSTTGSSSLVDGVFVGLDTRKWPAWLPKGDVAPVPPTDLYSPLAIVGYDLIRDTQPRHTETLAVNRATGLQVLISSTLVNTEQHWDSVADKAVELSLCTAFPGGEPPPTVKAAVQALKAKAVSERTIRALEVQLHHAASALALSKAPHPSLQAVLSVHVCAHCKVAAGAPFTQVALVYEDFSRECELRAYARHALRLAPRGRQLVSVVAPLGRALASALHALHAKNIVHCEVTMENVRVSAREGEVAPVLLANPHAAVLGLPSLLLAPCGPSVAPPPEQRPRAAHPAPAIDSWALGLVLAELLALVAEEEELSKAGATPEEVEVFRKTDGAFPSLLSALKFEAPPPATGAAGAQVVEAGAGAGAGAGAKVEAALSALGGRWLAGARSQEEAPALKECLALVKALCSKDPKARPTMAQVLQHPLFSPLPPAAAAGVPPLPPPPAFVPPPPTPRSRKFHHQNHSNMRLSLFREIADAVETHRALHAAAASSSASPPAPPAPAAAAAAAGGGGGAAAAPAGPSSGPRDAYVWLINLKAGIKEKLAAAAAAAAASPPGTPPQPLVRSPLELKALLSCGGLVPPRFDAEALYHLFDSDGNGAIDAGELLLGVAHLIPSPPPSAPFEEQFRRRVELLDLYFTAQDATGRGSLDREGLLALLEKMGVPPLEVSEELFRHPFACPPPGSVAALGVHAAGWVEKLSLSGGGGITKAAFIDAVLKDDVVGALVVGRNMERALEALAGLRHTSPTTRAALLAQASRAPLFKANGLPWGAVVEAVVEEDSPFQKQLGSGSYGRTFLARPRPGIEPPRAVAPPGKALVVKVMTGYAEQCSPEALFNLYAIVMGLAERKKEERLLESTRAVVELKEWNRKEVMTWALHEAHALKLATLLEPECPHLPVLRSLHYSERVVGGDVKAMGSGVKIQEVAIVSDLVENSLTLGTLMRDRGLTWGAVACIFRGVLKAALALNDAGILHRDIKADNILVDVDTFHPRLIDLGVARLPPPTKDPFPGGYLIGRPPEFLSNEKSRGEAAPPLYDVFSIGHGVVGYVLGGAYLL